jgi:hypothetical protein
MTLAMKLLEPNPFAFDASALPFINYSNWDQEIILNRDWAVLDRIPLPQTSLFSGEGGTGKSSVALHLCCAHVLGRDAVPLYPRAKELRKKWPARENGYRAAAL